MSRQSANFAAFPVLTQDSQGPQEVTWADPRQAVKSLCIRPPLTRFGGIRIYGIRVLGGHIGAFHLVGVMTLARALLQAPIHFRELWIALPFSRLSYHYLNSNAT